MLLAISNIAWKKEDDERVYQDLAKFGFQGLEIAPSRLISENPYSSFDKLGAIPLPIVSMQSIWYGKSGSIYNETDREELLSYTKSAILFAEKLGCENIVFGCPKFRNIPDGLSYDLAQSIAENFFVKISQFAELHGTVFSIEANPEIYNTNFINTTNEAVEIVKKINQKGCRVNLDLGTIIYNNDLHLSDSKMDSAALEFENALPYANHIHISEPWLKTIVRRPFHKIVAQILRKSSYKGYLSIEMGTQEDLSTVYTVLEYVKEVFG